MKIPQKVSKLVEGRDAESRLHWLRKRYIIVKKKKYSNKLLFSDLCTNTTVGKSSKYVLKIMHVCGVSKMATVLGVSMLRNVFNFEIIINN